jgi:dimethylhistidine N-methyltransferase
VTTLREFQPQTDDFREQILRGLRRPQKEVPSKFLYDERGSQLFERICELDEYYLTRTESAIMREHASDMAALLGERCLLIEYGSGSSTKTRTLLEHLRNPAGYVPVDISKEHLLSSARELARSYPQIPILPVCADYTDTYEVPQPEGTVSRWAVYFPGSTIGNFRRSEAVLFLQHIAEVCGSGGALLIGIDLIKDKGTLERAYDDSEGVTAEFMFNLLDRINRELDGDFQRKHFEYQALYDESHARVEMYLVSLVEQRVRIGDAEIQLEEGERIHTEYSHKYSLESFQELAEVAGFEVQRSWLDPDRLFSVQYLTIV